MTRLALVLCGFLIYFIQAQLLPAIFHTNWLPNLILTIIVMVTLFKGRRMGIMAAVIGGIVHDVLISNFFGLHLFPYVIVVYLLSAVKHRLYEERWYWSSAIVAICTLLDGFIRSLCILAYICGIWLYLYCSGTAYWLLSYMDCCGVRMNNKIIFGNNLVRG